MPVCDCKFAILSNKSDALAYVSCLNWTGVIFRFVQLLYTADVMYLAVEVLWTLPLCLQY
jgi:hypothetical protein